ncbi:hypothetical protein Hypma_002043 [Hypsizygus marmoreus]|uniref:Uncharacterized protein n=1 Tax=Hypsizygus marmoreus TaxID=39966 RepID=A0A369J9C3_HYPMA|nr:hypothetical protein Hypma_002043 [Hypsizygus marmoreus]
MDCSSAPQEVRFNTGYTISILNNLRCMEHVVYLAAKDFIEAINPTKSKSKCTTRNGTAAIEDDKNKEDDKDWTVDWTMLDELLERQEIDDSVDFEAGDVIGKILAFINQAINKFILLANSSLEVPTLKGKYYDDYKMSSDE